MSDYSSMATLQNNSQTPGYATAVQRAREVAAKIGSSKRPLEDGPEPTPKKLAPVEPVFTPQPPVMNFVDSVSPPGPVPGGRMIAGAGPGSGPTNLLPDQSINEYIRVPDRMVGLIIGRGGEQITRLQAESGCKIQMAPPSDGNPDRLCTLTGTRDAIQRAKELVNQIVNHRGRENAPQHQDQESGMNMGRPGGPNMMEEIMIPGAKVGLIIGKNGKTIKQLQEQTGAKMVVIQDGPNETAIRQEKPLRISGDPAKVEHAKQLVFELLANKDMQEPPRSYDDGYGGSDPGNGHATTSAEVLVPKVAIGVVIGHKGKMIKKIQADSGCRVQFNQEHDEEPGDKLCYLQGKPHQLDQARQMIEDLISSVKRCEEESRTRPVRGAGPQNGDRGMEYGQQWPDRPEVRCTFTIHGPKCGLVIGRGGEIIKQINAQSGAHCELDRRCQNNDRNTRTFVIRGHPEAVEACKRIVMEKVGGPINFIPEGNGNGNGNGNGGDGSGGGTPGPEYYGGGGGGGGAPAAWGYNPHWHQQNPSQGGPQQQVSVNPATGQLDYSQQWIDYYRSVGLVREAEAIEQAKIQQQQQQQQQQQDETSNQSLGGNDSGGPSTPQPSQDYSVQWAEYYRSIGKVKEAEAIEAQIKIKQQQQQPPPQPPQSMPPSDMGGDEATPPSQYAQYNMYQGGMYPGYGQYGYPAGNEHQ